MDPEHPLRAALDAAEPKPDPRGEREDKRNYAQRLSNHLAQTMADALRDTYKGVTPRADGTGQESAVPVDGGHKRLDVKVTDPALGLILSVSIKTYSFRDYDKKKDRLTRWTKNIVRNDHELRGEATVLHQRQPYAVLAGILFAPLEMCDDGNTRTQSSFAHAVNTLKKRAGRGRRAVFGLGEGGYMDLGAEDPRFDRFERVFVGLYEQREPDRGAVRFFDVEQPPPRTGRPADTRTLSISELVAELEVEVERRNQTAPTWDDLPESEADAS